MVFVRDRSGVARIVSAALVLGLVAPTLAGCAKRGGPVPYDVKNFGAPDEPFETELAQVYHIGPRDQLNITVYQVPGMSGDARVDTEGNLDLVLIGKVPVVGKTEAEVSDEIAKRLGEKYLQSPQVHVTVTESSREKVTVDGAVSQGGIYPINGTTTLMQAIALAHGTNESANPKRVVVFRTIDGKRMAAAFDLTDIRRGKMADPTIYGNDIIVVDGDQWRTRLRDIVMSIPIVGMFRNF